VTSSVTNGQLGYKNGFGEVSLLCLHYRGILLGWHLALDDEYGGKLRLPFKVDLRDFATWLSKKDPFSADDKFSNLLNWARSLESFLAAQVRYHSGGSEFNVEDLHAVAKRSALLLVFDGLDEVADISRRTEVVEEIDKGISRLGEVALSMQVIVTSRPAAFANSPGLPEDRFHYFHLESISRELINEYAERWLRARRLYGRESSEVRSILKEKLDQPHLRDLARNPMQLAILLSLIHTRGSSLPDKRTSLYDSYIDLFFGREAEKNAVVREHRDLLIDLHRYLAWILHSEAEGGHHRGSINVERLQKLLHDYLSAEGHDVGLVDKLFHGMIERVVALVSRVEGTFEFEVQPLREYFAARYLYETAPYSPPGDEKRGTKPDRFDVIARNFYWLNVTRFYAGCFSKGELPALVDRLQELSRDKQFRRLSHPRILAGILLSDWVFAQHPRSVREVVELVLDGMGVRYVVNSVRRRISSGTPLVLPKRSGNEELVDRCFDLLRSGVPRDFAMEITDVLMANSKPEELAARWRNEVHKLKGSIRSDWLEYGLWLGILPQLSNTAIEESISDDPFEVNRLLLILKAKHAAFIQSNDERSRVVIEGFLDGQPPVRPHGKSVLDVFAQALLPYRYVISMIQRGAPALSDIWKTRTMSMELNYEEPGSESAEILHLAKNFIDQAKVLASAPAIEWATTLGHWETLVEQGRHSFGDRWRFFCLSAVGAGIKSQQEKAAKHGELFDQSLSLVKRSRYARLQAGRLGWWKKHFDVAAALEQKMFVCLLAFVWCTPSALVSLIPNFEELLKQLPEANWRILITGIQLCLRVNDLEEKNSFDHSLPSKLAPRIAVCFGFRANEASRRIIFRKYLQQYNGQDKEILEFCQAQAIDYGRASSSSWNPKIAVLARAYRAGLMSEPYFNNTIGRRGGANLRLDLAEEIADNPDKYPGYLVAIAEMKFRDQLAKTIRPVAQIAERDCWFSD
jgi:hypothetical protein